VAALVPNSAWYSYTDADNNGLSTVSPAKGAKFIMTAGGANSTDSAAVITYNLNQGTYAYGPFVGFGFTLNADLQPIDLTGSTGVSFYYKGPAVNLAAADTNAVDVKSGNWYVVAVPAAATWTLETFTWSQFKQNTWAAQVPWTLTQVNKFQFQYTGATADQGTVAVDQFQINALAIAATDTTALAAKLATAKTLLASANIGTATGDYPTAAAALFTAAIAKSLAAEKDITPAIITAATTSLTTAIDAFTASKLVASLDTKALVAEIATATTAVSTAVVGNAKGDYTQTAKTTIQTAITTATAAEGASTQTAIDAATTTLTKALTDFIASAQAAAIDSSALIAEITLAKTAANAAVEGTSAGDYTHAAITAIKNAITAALVVDGSLTVTQANVDAAKTAITTAVATFAAAKITTAAPIVGEKQQIAQIGNTFLFEGAATLVNILGQVVVTGVNGLDASSVVSGIYFIIVDGTAKEVFVK
jgi:hypothetical protein